MDKKTRAELLEIKGRCLREFTQGGLYRIDPGGPVKDGFGRDTVPNDNGILFVAYLYFLFDALDILDEDDLNRWLDVCDRLKVDKEKWPGIINRRPGDYRKDAHDNYVGYVAGNVLFYTRFGDKRALQNCVDVHKHGSKYGFHFDNQYAYKDGKLDGSNWRPRPWRQGKDVALYNLAADAGTSMPNMLWFYLNTLLNACQSPRKTSEHMNTWLRQETVKLIGESELYEKMAPPIFFQINGALYSIWKIALKRKTIRRGAWIGLGEEFRTYFRYNDAKRPTKNPICELARELDY